LGRRAAPDWVEVPNARLPQPSDDLTQVPDEPPTWLDLKVPSEAELSAVLRRIVATVSDSRVNRREDQMRELLHLMLVKLESDAFYSRSVNHDKAVDFRIYDDKLTRVALTARKIRDLFKDYFSRQRTRIFHPHDRQEILLSDDTIYSFVAEL
jgi:hypothetical protein